MGVGHEDAAKRVGRQAVRAVDVQRGGAPGPEELAVAGEDLDAVGQVGDVELILGVEGGHARHVQPAVARAVRAPDQLRLGRRPRGRAAPGQRGGGRRSQEAQGVASRDRQVRWSPKPFARPPIYRLADGARKSEPFRFREIPEWPIFVVCAERTRCRRAGGSPHRWEGWRSPFSAKVIGSSRSGIGARTRGRRSPTAAPRTARRSAPNMAGDSSWRPADARTCGGTRSTRSRARCATGGFGWPFERLPKRGPARPVIRGACPLSRESLSRPPRPA